MSDFRISDDLADHPKTVKLVRRLGEHAFRCLVRLDGWIRRNRPDGTLRGLDAEDLAIAAGWSDNANQWCQTLKELRIIDWSDENQSFGRHGWREFNPWAAEANGRSEHAKKVNHERWHVKESRSEPACALCKPAGAASDDQTIVRTESLDESSPRIPSLLFPTTPRKKRPHGLFDVDSDAYLLSALLLMLIRERDPKAKGDLQQWAKDMDALLRLDGRTAAEVERIIRWSQADSFWSTNILSARKLRQQFSALLQKSNGAQVVPAADRPRRPARDTSEFDRHANNLDLSATG